LGGALACIASSLYPDLAPPENLELLHGSLEWASFNSDVSLHTKSGILWCHAESEERVITSKKADEIVDEIFAKQRMDGGWSWRELGPWKGWEGSASDCCERRDIRSDAYPTGFITLALARNFDRLGTDQKAQIKKAISWITRFLKNPYPAGPTYNTHNSGDRGLVVTTLLIVVTEDYPNFNNSFSPMSVQCGHSWQNEFMKTDKPHGKALQMVPNPQCTNTAGDLSPSKGSGNGRKRVPSFHSVPDSLPVLPHWCFSWADRTISQSGKSPLSRKVFAERSS
jgi:hypothetical protein